MTWWKVHPDSDLDDQDIQECTGKHGLRRSGAAGAEFGERVMLMTKGPNRVRQWYFGVWLGLATRTQDTHIGRPEGVAHAWANKRIGAHDRWKAEDVLGVCGPTSHPDPRRDGEIANVRSLDAAPLPPPQTAPRATHAHITPWICAPGEARTAGRAQTPPEWHSGECKGGIKHLLRFNFGLKLRTDRITRRRRPITPHRVPSFCV